MNKLRRAVNLVKELENNKNLKSGGWDKSKKRWFPHKSIEKGEDTLAYGMKLYPENYTEKEIKRFYSEGITDEEAVKMVEEYAKDKLKKVSKTVGKNVIEELNPNQLAALVSYVHNAGFSPSWNMTKKLKKALSKKGKERDNLLKEVSSEMDINTSNGRFNQALENRRQREREIFNKEYTTEDYLEDNPVNKTYETKDLLKDILPKEESKKLQLDNPELAVSTEFDGPRYQSPSREVASDYSNLSFKDAFQQAMRDKGEGETFEWKNKKYLLKRAEPKVEEKPKRSFEDLAKEYASLKAPVESGQSLEGDMPTEEEMNFVPEEEKADIFDDFEPIEDPREMELQRLIDKGENLVSKYDTFKDGGRKYQEGSDYLEQLFNNYNKAKNYTPIDEKPPMSLEGQEPLYKEDEEDKPELIENKEVEKKPRVRTEPNLMADSMEADKQYDKAEIAEEPSFFDKIGNFFKSGNEEEVKEAIKRPSTGNPQLDSLLQEYDKSMEKYKDELDSARTKDMWMNIAQGLMDYASYQNAAVGARAGLGIKPMRVDLQGNYAEQVRKQRPDIKDIINEASLYKEEMTPYQKELLKRKDRELDQNQGKVSTKLSDKEKIDYKIAAEEEAKVREQKMKDKEAAKNAIRGVNDIIDDIDRAIELSKKSKNSTFSKSGLIAGRTPTFTDLGQELEEVYSQISFNNFVEKAKGMSKAFDSEKEREFYEKTQPSILKDENVNIKNLKRLKERMLARRDDFNKDLGESKSPKPSTNTVLLESPNGERKRVKSSSAQKYIDKGAKVVKE